MALTPYERKLRLKRGSITSIAKRTRRAQPHVSLVVSGQRRDAVVEKEVARRIGLPVEAVFEPAEPRPFPVHLPPAGALTLAER